MKVKNKTGKVIYLSTGRLDKDESTDIPKNEYLVFSNYLEVVKDERGSNSKRGNMGPIGGNPPSQDDPANGGPNPRAKRPYKKRKAS